MSKRSLEEKSVLVMGAGFSTRPLVHYLSEQGYKVICASRGLEKAQKLVAGATNASVVQVDIEKETDLPKIEEQIQQVDLVISMLPYIHHPTLAKLAIKYKKHFCTTSYVSDGMKALEEEGKKAGIIMLNECGVDPGTDHMSAFRVFDQIHEKGGKVASFLSYCGGLPAAEDNNNPLGYKFSWAPRGVLLASKNTAKFAKDGETVIIPGEKLFTSYTHDNVNGVEYECYPNRDSTNYLDIYNLRDECKTLIRGTYRNKGWCDAVKVMADLDYLNMDVRTDLVGKTFGQITASLLKSESTSSADLKAAFMEKFSLSADSKTVEIFEWLGLFSDLAVPAVEPSTILDSLCDVMMKKMGYEEGERDMLLMQHTFVAEYPETKKKQTILCNMTHFGKKNGDTSMSQTVSYPIGIAVKLILQGKFEGTTGLVRPLSKEWYGPILKELSTLGVDFIEKWGELEDM
eukprot:TRINITY_DN11204_c0_g1_i1.p1 TRINITY_DN11204_c0_g1~~TRINITY_DN11204_c0_g1_i1.p1  ORF type:complete len:459 (-),score=142.75 TRINITY_DN11204_c0_g1_i1:205-1581(-)